MGASPTPGTLTWTNWPGAGLLLMLTVSVNVSGLSLVKPRT